MTQINVFEAEANFLRLLQMLEDGEEDVFVIARNGIPVADLKLMDQGRSTPMLLGFAEGKYDIPDDIDVDNNEIAKLFGI